MRSIVFTVLAEQDLSKIADYTFSQYGIDQARLYGEQLEACFAALADNPVLGRSADKIETGLRRFRHKSHVIFYLPCVDELVIVRVLHASMDFDRHFEE